MSIGSPLSYRSLVAATLSRLARVCREGEARFRHAADRALVDALRDVLLRWARERARFAHELEMEANLLGGMGPMMESRVFSHPPAIEPKCDKQRVDACAASEADALVEYERALRTTLPEELERLLRVQHAAIREAMMRLDQVGRGAA